MNRFCLVRLPFLILMGLVEAAVAAPPLTPSVTSIAPQAPVKAEDDSEVSLDFHGLAKEAILSETRAQGFFILEKKLRDVWLNDTHLASGSETDNKAMNLAAFYAANDLHIEALAVLKKVTSVTSDVRLALAQSHYAVGRYDGVLEFLEDEPLRFNQAAQLLMIRALGQLGRHNSTYALVRQNFPDGFPSAAEPETYLLSADAALSNDDLSRAQQDIDAIAQNSLKAEMRLFHQLIAGSIELAQLGNAGQLKILEASDFEPWASWAGLRLLRHRLENQSVGLEAAISELDQLLLRTDNKNVQRNIAWTRINLYKNNPLSRAHFDRLSTFIDLYPDANERPVAEARLRQSLTDLFDQGQTLSSMEAAQIFYENIDYAPPGQEGDTMIRNVVSRLTALDLSSSAVELLEHQVFKRLRGAQRSIVATDLAEIYLSLERPSETLRVLRSTRIAGLTEEIGIKRKLLEAAALEKVGDTVQALQLLQGGVSIEEASLQADIYWRDSDWSNAGRLYQYLVTKTGVSRDKAEEAFIRAGVSFSLAGETNALNALIKQGVILFDGEASVLVLDALAKQKEQGADTDKLLQFMNAYKRAYEKSHISG